MRCAIIPLTLLCAFAQTQEQPARLVSDPGVITTRQAVTPAGVQSVFQGRVYGIAFGESPAHIWALTNGFVYHMDWRANRVVERIPYSGKAGLAGICFAGGRIVLAGAGKTVRVFAVTGGKAAPVGSAVEGALAGSLASAGGVTAVPVISHNRLAVFGPAGTRLLDTGKAPFGVVLNAGGTVAYVSNWGGRTPTARDLTAPTGLLPTSDRVVVDARGIASTGTLTRMELPSGRITHTISVGLHPTAMVWDEARGRLYVANGNEDSVSVIDTRGNRVAATFPVQPFARKVAGIAPTALVLGGGRLYVACGGINAVAVLAPADGKLLGLIPTGWYPTHLALSGDGKLLAVSTLLGAGSGWRDEPRKRFVHANRGSVHVIPVPDAAQLASYTAAVAENNHVNAMAERKPNRAATPRAVPNRAGEPSLIEHVVYIVKENRTYDQVLGDMPQGNGDPSLVMFGAAVTPNQHRLAGQFVLMDNFYATGGNSGDGHQWLTQANETDYCLWPGYVGRSYPFDGTDPIAYSKNGFIWDAALRTGKTVRVYGEYAGRLSDRESRPGLLRRWRDGENFSAAWNTVAPLAPLNAILAKNYPPYSTAIPDVIRAQLFLKDLESWKRAGKMPNLVIVQLPSNHTRGTSPGTSSPKAMVADNDLALGQIVQALTRTAFWRRMAIFVVEDDAQNGVDHVDGHRTVALVASPYARRGVVDSTMYSHPSILKTIELMLGLPSLSLFDLIANSMSACFTDAPDYRPYELRTPDQSLFEVNPERKALRGAPLRAALHSARMRFDVPDAAPVEALNRILWHDVRGWNTPYPGTKHAAFAPLSADSEEDER